MSNDPRCCGTGTCLINADGECWCGQRWDGEKMCHAPLKPFTPATPPAASTPTSSQDRNGETPDPD